VVEQVGGRGFLVLRGQRFAIGSPSQHKCIQAKDINWDDVMVNGGFGDRFIVEEDEEEG
jgi:hypothetical protein